MYETHKTGLCVYNMQRTLTKGSMLKMTYHISATRKISSLEKPYRLMPKDILRQRTRRAAGLTDTGRKSRTQMTMDQEKYFSNNSKLSSVM